MRTTTQKIMQRLGLLLLALVFTATAGAQNNNEMTIASKADWQAFRDRVDNGERLNAKLTTNIDLGTDIVMLGNSISYSGTFDGQGHTLSFDWNAGYDSEIAPFWSVEGATIKNLRVQGKITTKGISLSGLVLEANGTTTFSRCVSDVHLTGGGRWIASGAAGMVQKVNNGASVTITDCLVKGSITDNVEEGRRRMAGFVYEQTGGGTCTLTNCLYLGTNNATDYSCTFAPDGATLNNCLYLNTCGKAQGEEIYGRELKSGYVAGKLQAGRTDGSYWAQVLGENPSLYSAADKAKTNYVYYDSGNRRWACDNFRLTDGTALPIGIDFTAANVTYNRTGNSAQNATICLPYELPRNNSFQAHFLSGGGNDKVYFKEATGTLEAYRPYYITANGTPQLGGTNLQVKAYKADALTATAKGYTFTGTVTGMSNATAAAAKAYILQDDGKFHKVTTAYPEAVVPIYRAYITCPPQASGAKELFVVLDGVEPTGINGVTNDAADVNSPVYDLQGRRVADRLDDTTRNTLPAGVYIVGGRKVIVK